MQYKQYIDKMHEGDIYSLAKIITIVESGSEHTGQIMQEVFPNCKGTHTIGITGPPGAGKSSIIYHLAKSLREKHKKTAILAIDPNSHITGGALLGDRIRMDDLQDVYIRSIGNRCETGGISSAAYFIIKILESCKYEYIFIETVGAGQSEVKIKDLADTTLLLLAPGLGDDIQANKAGIMEIADIMVLNKCDKPDAIKMEIELKDMIKNSSDETPLFLTDCVNGTGIPKLSDYILNTSANQSNETSKLKTQCINLIESRAKEIINQSFNKSNSIDILDNILAGETNINTFIENKLDELFIE